MSDYTTFAYEEQDAVASVTFSRPERLNALTFEVYQELADLTANLKQNPETVRVLVIRGQGKGFCSGGDVEEIIRPLLEIDARGVYEFARLTGSLVRNIREMPQPVIAAVNGLAAGAGAVIATACDLRVLADSAAFQFLFTKVGISGGDMGACWLLPRIVGLGRASELLLLGDRIDAHAALQSGLANSVVPADGLDEAADELAKSLQQRAPWGLAITKELLNRAASSDYSTAIEMEAWTQSLLMMGGDFGEFYRAFTDKRPPDFKGR